MPSPETKGECIISRVCMDTVEMQMVYVEMEGQERWDREQGQIDVLDRCTDT